jgi:hypothetical protein
MDPRENPYTPNAGARPPALVGRDAELEAFDILLHRLKRGYTEQSMLITGLRGVGKTVLLGAFEDHARAGGWISVEAEITKNEEFGRRMAMLARRALLQAAPRERWTDRMSRAAAVLKSFYVTFSPVEGTFTAGFDVDAEAGMADSGSLSDDLADVFVALGDAARDQDTGVAFLLDEVQFLKVGELEALIMALHKTVQRSLPITLVGAGLPQLPRLAGEAKSYAERLFKFPQIGQLDHDEAAPEALTKPARDLGVEYEPAAVTEIVNYTEGYPYFLQEYGKIVWDIAPEDGPISLEVVLQAQPLVEEKLDGSFFRVRAERTSELELQYLRAMAELGAGPLRTGEVAEALNRTSDQLGPTRARLIDKGLLYTPGHGLTAFTVPQFDRYMRRNYDLNPPPVQARRRRSRGSK